MAFENGVPKIVLVVDDEPSILGLLKTWLESEGFAVLTEKTGQAAIEVVGRTKLHAVFLDLGLHDIEGMEVLCRIRKLCPWLCVVVVTGCHEESQARRAIQMGAWDYVTKPINFNHLKNILLLQAPG